MYPQQNYPPPNNQNNYDFIINPPSPAKRRLLNGSSVAVKVGLLTGVLFFLLISFVIVRALLGGSGSNGPALISVLTQQQELIRISSAASNEEQSLSDSTKNAVITTELSLIAAKAELVTYTKTSGQKVDPKKLIYPGRRATDAQLSASLSAGTYDSTLRDVLETQLGEYEQSLKTAFNKTKGTKGRELLNKQYEDAQLLQKQLETGL